MKIFIVKFTEDFGDTIHTILVNANTYTEAYTAVEKTLSENGAIISVIEVSEGGSR